MITACWWRPQPPAPISCGRSRSAKKAKGLAIMDIPLCQGPDPHPRKPHFNMPAGATDTHFHLFGLQSRYPPVDLREYTPQLVTPALARQLFNTLGIQRAVVI